MPKARPYPTTPATAPSGIFLKSPPPRDGTTTGSSNVIIAVIDSGVDPAHPDLAGKLIPGYNFLGGNTDTHDVKGHGTAVAGSAAASSNNAKGVAGVAWDNPLMPLVVLDASNTLLLQYRQGDHLCRRPRRQGAQHQHRRCEQFVDPAERRQLRLESGGGGDRLGHEQCQQYPLLPGGVHQRGRGDGHHPSDTLASSPASVRGSTSLRPARPSTPPTTAAATAPGTAPPSPRRSPPGWPA